MVVLGVFYVLVYVDLLICTAEESFVINVILVSIYWLELLIISFPDQTTTATKVSGSPRLSRRSQVSQVESKVVPG